MEDYIYPTWSIPGNELVKDMLFTWQESKKRYLCFPWIKFKVHTLSKNPFWMFFYYSKSWSNNYPKAGMIEYRIHTLNWSTTRFTGNETYLYRGLEEGKIWFKCDQYQEVTKSNHSLLTLDDFRHLYGKNLVSTIRTSISPVKCLTDLVIVSSYP